MAGDLADLLSKWQTLTGALLGGAFSLSVALLVAYKARRAEERGAAMLLISDIVRLEQMVIVAFEVAETKEDNEHSRQFSVVASLCHYRSRLSPSFDGAAARVMLCDVYLAATLSLVSSLVRETEPSLGRLEEDIEQLNRGREPERLRNVIEGDVKSVFQSYHRLGPYAKLSRLLLEQQVLGHFPVWHKLRRRFRPVDWEKELFHTLATGNVVPNSAAQS